MSGPPPDEEEEEELEHTLLVVREVNVYRVPPRSTSGGYKCAEWLVSSKIWSGRLRVVSAGPVCEIRLEDVASGELFAACRVAPGQREAFVEAATDSSRYFVLKIDDGRGRHAFIGLGFNERNEAFDFNVALSDHEKHLRAQQQQNQQQQPQPPGQRHAGLDASGAAAPAPPSLDFRLKEGQTITINMKSAKSASDSGNSSASMAGKTATSVALAGPGLLAKPPSAGTSVPFLAPPPGSKTRVLNPPTAAAPATSSSSFSSSSVAPTPLSSQYQGDGLSSFAGMKASLPTAGSSTSSSGAGGGSSKQQSDVGASPAAGWTAF